MNYIKKIYSIRKQLLLANFLLLPILILLTFIWGITNNPNYEPWVQLIGFIAAIFTSIPIVLSLVYPELEVCLLLLAEIWEIGIIDGETSKRLIKTNNSINSKDPVLYIKIRNISDNPIPILINDLIIEFDKNNELPTIIGSNNDKITSFCLNSDNDKWLLYPSQEAIYYVNSHFFKFVKDCGISKVIVKYANEKKYLFDLNTNNLIMNILNNK